MKQVKVTRKGARILLWFFTEKEKPVCIAGIKPVMLRNTAVKLLLYFLPKTDEFGPAQKNIDLIKPAYKKILEVGKITDGQIIEFELAA